LKGELKMSNIKFPDIEVNLSESDGNAFAVIGAVRRALRKAGVPDEKIKEFSDDAMSGDYDHVLQTCMKWVDIS
jgi:hypothetical protein